MCIASDSCDFLSCLVFAETQVKSELLSSDAWQTGGDLSSDCISCSSYGNFAFLGYDVFSFCLEFVR